MPLPAVKEDHVHHHHEYMKQKDSCDKDEIELSSSLKLPRDDIELESLVGPHEDEGHPVQLSSHSHYAQGTATNAQLAFNIIISFVGAGLLGMPHAMQQSGWLLGSIAVSIVSGLNVYAMLLLVNVRKRLEQRDETLKNNIHGYGDVGRIILGPKGELIVNLCLVISQIGFATAYIIFIASNVQSMYPNINSAIICFGCIPILAILVQAKEMATLSPFSLLADVANFAGLSAVLFQDFELYHHDDSIILANWSQLYYVIAISVYSLEGVGLILPLESSAMNRQAFPFLLKAVIAAITVVMCLFGTAGYLAFGSQTLAPITLNLGGVNSLSSWFVKLSLCLALYLTYPIMMFPVHGIVEPWCRGRHLLVRRGFHPIVMRTSFVVATACIAYGIPDFGKFLSLVGSSICTLLGFILPCYFHFKVFHDIPYWQIVLNGFIIVGATIFAIVGTYHSFVSLLDGAGDSGGEL